MIVKKILINDDDWWALVYSNILVQDIWNIIFLSSKSEPQPHSSNSSLSYEYGGWEQWEKGDVYFEAALEVEKVEQIKNVEKAKP